MVRQHKSNNQFYIDCSNCKCSAGVSGSTDGQAVSNAERLGFAVIGKFHFCPSCFSYMLERWRLHNLEILKEVSNG